MTMKKPRTNFIGKHVIMLNGNGKTAHNDSDSHFSDYNEDNLNNNGYCDSIETNKNMKEDSQNSITTEKSTPNHNRYKRSHKSIFDDIDYTCYTKNNDLYHIFTRKVISILQQMKMTLLQVHLKNQMMILKTGEEKERILIYI